MTASKPDTGGMGAAPAGTDDGREREARSRVDHAVGAGRVYLAALDAVIVHDVPSLACGLVARTGGPVVLNVISIKDPKRSVDVGCESLDGDWWFMVDGERLASANQPEDAVAALTARLNPAGPDRPDGR